MKILIANRNHKDILCEFLQRKHQGESSPSSAELEAEGYMNTHDGCLFLVTDHVSATGELSALYDYPMLGEDMMVGFITVSAPATSENDLTLQQIRDVTVCVSQEYHDEVNLVLVLRELISTIVMNGMPYKRLWFVQAGDQEESDAVLCSALKSADIATAYINEQSGTSGYFADLRVGHYLWSALSRRQVEEE